jgi:hypothetical protein
MKFLFIIISIICFSNCTKNEKKYPNLLPSVLFFKIIESNNKLPDTILDSLKMFYFDNNIKTYVLDFSLATNEVTYNAYSEGVLATRDVGFLSGDKNIKMFYLEYPNKNLDTLLINYKLLPQSEAEIEL